ncbi:glycosyl-phosphatidylinositol-anchored molecule-like protein [Phacochoerus africanus]|uniref:glycosyl-phosphatidylinositol-anchored molecule-like protein n=1 Tax=Phacochoerus africanus TaxID=41426 RepID=UPI001FD9C8B1|nr:glycosyl-phosphatidylinositol-anchored molecule-like protein [Phacochoerus africanus]
MLLPLAFLLITAWPWGFIDRGDAWTYNLRCHECFATNTFSCIDIRTCPYHIRRCLTVSIRVNAREILVYKDCTFNCTFVYPEEQMPEAPRARYWATNSFYWVHCCNTMTCNHGGPTNLERDIVPEEAIEEELGGTVRLGEATLFLSLASVLVSHALT